jgi:hypothetical protein
MDCWDNLNKGRTGKSLLLLRQKEFLGKSGESDETSKLVESVQFVDLQNVVLASSGQLSIENQELMSEAQKSRPESDINPPLRLSLEPRLSLDLPLKIVTYKKYIAHIELAVERMNDHQPQPQPLTRKNQQSHQLGRKRRASNSKT